MTWELGLAMVVGAATNAIVAARKNRNVAVWFCLGALLGLLPIIVLGALSTQPTYAEARRTARFS